MSHTESDLTVGWREWVRLPGLGLDWIKAKVDTGARTSALHAFTVERFERDGSPWVRFDMHPVQGDNTTVVSCEAAIIDDRCVTDSGGHKEQRPVIKTQIMLGDEVRDIEMTLTDRDGMLFRMLLGRTAIQQGVLVSPGQSFRLGGTRELPPESP